MPGLAKRLAERAALVVSYQKYREDLGKWRCRKDAGDLGRTPGRLGIGIGMGMGMGMAMGMGMGMGMVVSLPGGVGLCGGTRLRGDNNKLLGPSLPLLHVLVPLVPVPLFLLTPPPPSAPVPLVLAG